MTPENNVVGVDPQVEEEIIETPNAEPVNEPKPVDPKPESKSLSKEEYDQLVDQVRNYQTIIKEPGLVDTIRDHFRSKALTNNAPPKKDDVKDNPDVLSLKEQNRELTNRLARLEVEHFRKHNPDMDEHREAMAKLLSDHPTLTIEQAYKFAKADKPPQQTQKVVKTTPTTEITDTDSGEQSDDEFSAYEKQINDPKATPSFDKAIDLAMRAARKIHSKK